MSLRIRLRRVGRKKQPSYRLVVTNSASPRDGAYIDEVGFYNPRTQPAQLRLDLEKVEAWMGKGATLSTTAASLLRKARKGGDAKVGLQTAVAPVVEAAPVVEEKPKKRAPAKAGSAGSGKKAAPAAEATEAAPPDAAPTEGETSAPAEAAAE